MPKQHMKPGEKAPVSGQYQIVDKNGNKSGIERTVVKNEPLPPTPKKQQTYIITDKTKTQGK